MVQRPGSMFKKEERSGRPCKVIIWLIPVDVVSICIYCELCYRYSVVPKRYLTLVLVQWTLEQRVQPSSNSMPLERHLKEIWYYYSIEENKRSVDKYNGALVQALNQYINRYLCDTTEDGGSR